VPYIPESVKQDIKDQVRDEVAAQAKAERWGAAEAVPEWTERVKIDGDVRVRYQADKFASANRLPTEYFDSEDITNFAGLSNTTFDDKRYRIRARVGVTAKVADPVGVGIRLSTGNQNGPVSTSSTAGDPANRYTVKIDRAYIRYTPFTFATVDAGRITNPFFSTEILYASDLGFDGFAVTARPEFNPVIKPFVTAGWFPLRHNAIAGDRILKGVQVGSTFNPSPQLGLRLGVARYKTSGAQGGCVIRSI
jgi:hypothetical protein